MELADIPSVSGLRSKADQAKGIRSAVEAELERAVKQVKQLEAEDEILALTLTLLKKLMDREVTDAKEVVETLLSEGLQNVFNDQNLRVRADVSELRGKVSLDLTTVEKHQGGMVTEGVSDESNGGSVTTVQSVLMRIITTMQRELRPILVLDESLPAFDPRYVNDMMGFLVTLCERLGFDIILVTQNHSLTDYATISYDLKKAGGKAVISRSR